MRFNHIIEKILLEVKKVATQTASTQLDEITLLKLLIGYSEFGMRSGTGCLPISLTYQAIRQIQQQGQSQDLLANIRPSAHTIKPFYPEISRALAAMSATRFGCLRQREGFFSMCDNAFYFSPDDSSACRTHLSTQFNLEANKELEVKFISLAQEFDREMVALQAQETT